MIDTDGDGSTGSPSAARGASSFAGFGKRGYSENEPALGSGIVRCYRERGSLGHPAVLIPRKPELLQISGSFVSFVPERGQMQCHVEHSRRQSAGLFLA